MPPPNDVSPMAAPAPVIEAATPHADLTGQPARFFNRELSWLAFNRRVLAESMNVRHPLLERLRFLAISANNLDEFYMVRVAGLKAQVREDVRSLSQDGLTPGEPLIRVNEAAADLMSDQQTRWRELCAELADEGLRYITADEVTIAERAALEERFLSALPRERPKGLAEYTDHGPDIESAARDAVAKPIRP